VPAGPRVYALPITATVSGTASQLDQFLTQLPSDVLDPPKLALETQEINLGIQGMTCASCVVRVEKALGKVPGYAPPATELSLAELQALERKPMTMRDWITKLDEFLKTQSTENIKSRNPDYAGYSITRPRLAAGDLLVWTSLLLHGNGHNTSGKPRLCQYLTMNPSAQMTEETRQARIEWWRNNTHPASKAFPGDPRRIEEQRTEPARLTDLGMKLLGIDRWDD